uniref:Glycosyltransferase family 92 protein n=1 Tax=Corethron hystrix TaxID=216773 RepID=A0A7S1BMR2_9STRA|mmetsp:Transcript_34331/g.79401  ORF Transcript_34331/g.79401 Transcript_34331/m.79401 type:complete len:487 (+) Transcript_34331:364-1824(+)
MKKQQDQQKKKVLLRNVTGLLIFLVPLSLQQLYYHNSIHSLYSSLYIENTLDYLEASQHQLFDVATTNFSRLRVGDKSYSTIDLNEDKQDGTNSNASRNNRAYEKESGKKLIEEETINNAVVDGIVEKPLERQFHKISNSSINEENDSEINLINTSDSKNITEGGISGCLLIKDDNDRLAEWIAYHVTSLPMRYLIVAVDPDARQSPMDILDRYVSAGIINVELWDDSNYCKWCINGSVSLDTHEIRQKEFIGACSKRHRELGRTWTIMIDTDEFLVWNRIPEDPKKWTEDKRKGSLRDRRMPFNEYNEATPRICSNDTHIEYRAAIRTPRNAIPPTGSNVSLSEFIHMHKDENPFNSPCVNLPRLYFGSIESAPEKIAELVPEEVDAMKFSTLRFRNHAIKGAMTWNRYSKALVDVSRVTISRVRNPHCPFSDCAHPFPCHHDALFRVQHYLGSYESYASRRNYVLRSKEVCSVRRVFFANFLIF